jgi:sulfur-carrier protein
MRVRVYATLRDVVGANALELDVHEPTDVRRVLHELSVECPQLGRKLWDAQGELNRAIQVLVNGRSIQFLRGLETSVAPADRVDLFPPVGGG